MKKARIDAANITIPENIYHDQGLQAAENTSKLFHSPEFQERIRCEEQRLEKEVFDPYIKPWKKKRQQAVSVNTGSTNMLEPGEKIVVFISSSILDETVHGYVKAFAKAKDPNLVLAMRGLVGGITNARQSHGESYFNRIMKVVPDCSRTEKPCERFKVPIQINPSLFTRYGITKVPTIVYEHNDQVLMIQGEAPLDYLLERVNREAKSSSMTNLIKKMRSKL